MAIITQPSDGVLYLIIITKPKQRGASTGHRSNWMVAIAAQI